MDDRIRIGIAWVLTFTLCAVLISTVYWNQHWGIFPIGR